MYEYSIENESLERYKLMDKHLLGSDLILMLLSLSPIKGSTKMQKQVFLTWKELFSDITFEPGFFPWRYGAFNKLVEDTLKVLEKQKYFLYDLFKRLVENTAYDNDWVQNRPIYLSRVHENLRTNEEFETFQKHIDSNSANDYLSIKKDMNTVVSNHLKDKLYSL